jgi:hypothetical protein
VTKRENLDIRKWAVLGAEQRLKEIDAEWAAIYQTLPELRRAARRRAGHDAEGAPARALPKRKRRKMSAEARKRISDAQKARWARQRAQGSIASGGGGKRR